MKRLEADGAHLRVDGRPFHVRGTTYGSFRRRVDGAPFPDSVRIKQDLAAMADLGLNTVRVYDLPPPELLEVAGEQGLRVLVGFHFSDWRMEPDTGGAARKRVLDAGRRAVRDTMELVAGRDEVLAVSVGNEVPVDLVRLHGIGHVEEVLSEMVAEVHRADPAMLATYVNYPTTEFLQIEGQDLACFNVFLEEQEPFRRYLRHLQVAAGGLPVILSETGLASELHGPDRQAETLEWQLRTVDETGCAGAFVYAWTDEWAVADEPVTGWGFGIMTEKREPKPAVEVVDRWSSRSLVDVRDEWPRISVIVCAYNEERTIEECLASLAESGYPDLDVIMCDDGSTDRTLEIARRFPFRILELPHGGLSRARNAGMEAATGEIIAYLDADAAAHPEWPFHLALSLEDEAIVATGGPNLPVEDAGFVERVVANSPGAPMEVLVGDDRAEHVPGCNMAFRAGALREIGGFDAAYTSAGDDVDVCWKLLDRGDEIGFAPAAQVRHHRRGSVRGYLRQQKGYGRAERMLSGPHRHRFNRLGQARWSGFIYDGARLLPSLLRPVIYHGYQGGAPYQPVTARPAETAASRGSAVLPLSLPVAMAGAIGAIWSPWWLLVPLVMAVAVIGYGTAVAAGLPVDRDEPHPLRLRALAGLMHVVQPFVRAWGRICNRPLPARDEVTPPWWGDRSSWLATLRRELEAEGCRVDIGSPDAAYDLTVSAGPFLRGRISTAVVWDWEPRWRVRWYPSWWLVAAVVAAAVVALGAPLAGAMTAAVVGVGVVIEGSIAGRRVSRALDESTRGSTT